MSPRTLLASVAAAAEFEIAAGAVLDFTVDWDTLDADTIASATWTVVPSATLSSQTVAGTRCSAFLAAATAGQWYALTCAIVTDGGRSDSRTFRVLARPSLVGQKSALFPDAVAAVAQIRRDKLVSLAASRLAGATLNDDDIWKKLLAAEAEVERIMRVWLTPRDVLPMGPTYDAEAAAIEAAGGKVYREPGYDWSPELFPNEPWGMVELLNRPVISVAWMRFAYPSQPQPAFEIPANWIRPEGRTNRVSIVPDAMPLLGAFVNLAVPFGWTRPWPFLLQVRYRAGLVNALAEYPDLAVLVPRMAILSLLDDMLPPQSGSVSADGLSQSISLDVDKLRDAVHAKLDALQEKAQGIRVVVI